jgi:hypothetical protein
MPFSNVVTEIRTLFARNGSLYNGILSWDPAQAGSIFGFGHCLFLRCVAVEKISICIFLILYKTSTDPYM